MEGEEEILIINLIQNTIMIQKIINLYNTTGLTGFIDAVRAPIFPRRSKKYYLAKNIVLNKYGLEIGGPSSIFKSKGVFPIYNDAGNLDNCNYSGSTMWEGTIKEGANFIFNNLKPAGKQYICESTDLSQIADSTYDFIISSHMLEHTANPIKALKEWVRVLKNQGSLLLILPDGNKTFDNKRHVTTINHLIDDYNKNTGEDDLTHLAEILKLHNFDKDPWAGSFEKFKERSKNNIENRGLHHHVFNRQLVIEMLSYLKLRIIETEVVKPFHITAIAQKN